MNTHYSETRKIHPGRGEMLDDHTVNDGDRVEIGPTLLALQEWEAAGLTLPNLPRMREFRHRRLTDHIVARDWGGILLFDPLNIRYATDCTNMQLWNTHNPFRAVLLCADGHMVLWEYKNARFLAEGAPLVNEIRPGGAGFFYFGMGDGCETGANDFADDVRDLLNEHGGGNMRLGVDKIMLHGADALRARGFELMEGEECTERARAVKGPDEILAMRCAMHACEASVAEMQAGAQPGLSENEIWAELHRANIARGGEWIETRLLATGPRTNPWFQECGPRRLQNNEILAFDTDLVGVYGICVDISRTWWIGDRAPRPDMIAAMQHGHEHIMTNMEMLRPGVTIPELVENAHRLAPEYTRRRYSCMFHGVGLCDEWPLVPYPQDFRPGQFDHALEPGMVLCVEALVGADGGDFSIKLEDQVLITEDGYENLTQYPFCPHLMGQA